MDDVTQILMAVERGEEGAREELLRLVEAELRGMARHLMAREARGNTLQATALVNEVYLRLFDRDSSQHWDGRGHFFAAAAEAMRRILVGNARHKKRLKRGGGSRRVGLNDALVPVESPVENVVAVHEVLDLLAAVDPVAAELVKLRYFTGLSAKEAAAVLDISERSGYRKWDFAKAWLYKRIHGDDSTEPGGTPPAV
jgi:RNA polymerase sigma factor (TIGR02999 family)